MPSPSTLPLPEAAELAGLCDLCDRARFVEAWAAARHLRPPETWVGAEARIVAGRLLSNWGAPTLADRVHWLTFRRHPDSLPALTFAAYSVSHRHGAPEALALLARHWPATTAVLDPVDRARLLSFRGTLWAMFRDFERAETACREALVLAPDDVWLQVELAFVRERQDRYDEALALGTEALAARPWYRPALVFVAHLLQLLGRDRAAVELLEESRQHIQSGQTVTALIRLLIELGDYPRAAAIAGEIDVLYPRLEHRFQEWVTSMRADVAYQLGDWPAAVAAAARSRHPFQVRMAERLATVPVQPRRTILPVRFVRQHHMTCAPATLAAIAHYWGREVDQAELAAEITYDGTPDHVERHWAETHGWHVREFRVTWDIAIALIDRGCPFTLTTVQTRSAHLQAVIGYDAVLGTIIVRDPYERMHGEWIADSFFESAAGHGPRGMILLPADRRALVDELSLPEAEIYDAIYRASRALHGHDRAAAAAAISALETIAPGHRLTLRAQRHLSSYDGTSARSLELTEQLLALHPGEPNLVLDRLYWLQQLGRTPERSAALQAAALAPGADAALLKEWAEQLNDDHRHARRAVWVARRAARRLGGDAASMRTLANSYWALDERARAAELYRLAATRADKEEDYWRSWFIASRHTGRVEECLAMLRERATRLRTWSSAPVNTLFQSLDELDRTAEALILLEETLGERPTDGALLLFAARQQARHGRRDRARELLAAAQPLTRRAAWLRAAAYVATCDLDHAGALAAWQELLALDGCDADAQNQAARLIAIVHGREAAIQHLRAAIERYPHFVPLHVALAERLRHAPAGEQLRALDDLLALEPRNAWAWRERAAALREADRLDEALAAAEHALAEDPQSPSSHGTKGDVLQGIGRLADARACFAEGLRINSGADWLVSRLLSACSTADERRAALACVRDEILRQPFWVDTVLELRTAARGILPNEEIQSWLEALHAARPEQWQMWIARCAHHVETGDPARALAIAEEAAQRFPYVPRVWQELADTQGRLGRTEAQVDALERAINSSPAWLLLYQKLGHAHESRLDLAAAERAYRRGLAADPFDSGLHGHLADVCWKLGRRDEAVTALTKAVQLDPGYSWGWRQLQFWHGVLGQPEATLTAARQAAEARAGEARGWLQLAELLQENQRTPEALAAIERALTVEPRHHDALDQRAFLLAQLHRYEAALAACAPAVLAESIPHTLRGRRAWILARQGRRDAAITELRELVTTHPHYAWGWENLCDWLSTSGRHGEAIAAAEQLVRLRPTHNVAWGYLADCQLHADQREAGIRSLREALKLQPDYVWAVRRLFGLLLADRDWAGARQLLASLRAHAEPATAQSAEVRLLVAEDQREPALAALRPLLVIADREISALDEALAEFKSRGWWRDAERLVRTALADPAAPARLGRSWVTLWCVHQSWWHLRHLRRREIPSALVDQALCHFLAFCGDRRRRWLLRLLTLVAFQRIHEPPEVWATMGYALAEAGLRRHARWWLGDWPRRAEVTPWMLTNLAETHVVLGNHAAADAVVRRALALPPDHAHADLAAVQAYLAAMQGDFATAGQWLQSPAPSPHLMVPSFCRVAARALVDVGVALPDHRREALAIARVELERSWRQGGRRREVTRLFRRVLRHLGRTTRSWSTWFEGAWPGPIRPTPGINFGA